MLVWLLMLGAIVVLWFALPEALGEKKKKLIFLVISGVLMAFLMGSRCPVRSGSADVYWYYVIFIRTSTDTIEEITRGFKMEHGYLIMNRILYSIIPWGQLIIYLEAAFTTFTIFWFIYRNTDDVFSGVIAYICVGSWGFFLTGFRQAFAICLCLYALELMKRKAFATDLLALLIIAFASLMHITAWLYVAVFIIRSFKLNRFTVLAALGVTAVTFVSLEYIVGVFEKASNTEFSTGYEGNILGGIVPIAVFSLSLGLSYLAYVHDKSFLEEHSLHLLLLLVGLCLYLFRYNTVVFERVSYYFTVVICVMLPNALNAIRNPRSKIIGKALCLALCIGLFVYRMADSSNYYFYWQPYV